MARFAYKAVDFSGKSIKGDIVAVSESEVVNRLEKNGQIVVSITEKVLNTRFPIWKILKHKRTDKNQLEFFSRQLATLLKAGIPVIEAFEALERDAELTDFSNVLQQMSMDIQNGASLAESMGKHDDVFSNTFVRMIKAGEAGGVVPDTLEQVAAMLEEQRENTQTVKNATRYPIIVFGTLIVAFFVLVMVILPKLAKMFKQFGTTLPLPTRIMLQLYSSLKEGWYLYLIAIAVIAGSVYFLFRLSKVRYAWDRNKLRLPIFGSLFSKLYMEKFCLMVKALLDAGVPMFSVLENVSSTIGNSFAKSEIDNLRNSVHAGQSMSAYMRHSSLFSSLVTQMTGLGEKSGRLPELLDLCAKHYRQEIRYKTKNLLTSIEPILTVVIGALVFFFMLSIFMPIWDTVKFLK